MGAKGATGTLFVVATPLGNLDDITQRALETLRQAAVVACEDTRRTRGLLSRFAISPPKVTSCHKFNERSQAEPLLNVLRSGGNVALVTDSGTPGISDPGSLVVAAAFEAGLPVCPIPGPSAAAAAVSVAGFTADSWLFIGFLPRKAGHRRTMLAALALEPRPMVFFEAPHRVLAMVADLAAVFGDRPVTMLREMTKLHEEVRRSTLLNLTAELAEKEPRGEFTFVVDGPRAGRASGGQEKAEPADEELRVRYRALLAAGALPKDARKTLARETGLVRRRIYSALLTQEGED